MTEQEVKLVVGSLLHDVGKVIYRSGDGRNHSKSGYDYLKDEIHIDDPAILEPVLYHHADMLKSAQIADDSGAYITYIADNIAAASDRRKNENDNYGFEMSMPLQPVFNILNGNHGQQYYHPQMLDGKKMNYPTEQKQTFDEVFYKQVKEQLTVTLNQIEWSEQYINSLLAVLEATMTYIPSSTSKQEVADISLYDHVKMTAAVGSCIYQYLKEQGVGNYRETLFQETKEFYDQKAFLLYSIDLSGIQSFIYTIHSKNALKMLRARSFYLEIMMEHIVDTLLERLSLSRANLLYSGGGHCYILLPNTLSVKEQLEEYIREINVWLRETYDVALYAAAGYAEASANNLCNIPEKSYADLFRRVSNQISKQKASRYSATEIITLNHQRGQDYTRECRVCKSLESLNADGLCPTCEALKNVSSKIMDEELGFFVIVNDPEENGLPLPCGAYMIAESESKLRNRMKEQPDTLIRVYSKNRYYTGLNVATKIWVGDYTQGQTFEELAESAKNAGAIRRMGVLRSDVDNMGQAFTGGFSETYNTLSRTATLSRQLSLFFKCYINQMLGKREYSFTKEEGKHNATIVYSGGDDLFIVGAWNEIIEIALDIQSNFAKYTEGTLTISAGIGMYDATYPISQIAYEVGELEEESKGMPGKNAVTLLPDGEDHTEQIGEEVVSLSDGTYTWDMLRNQVLGEKYKLFTGFFRDTQERGTAFMYHLLELIRGRNESVNFARYVYLLARLEPGNKADPEQKRLYKEFSREMYKWIYLDEDCRQIKTAMNLYAYMKRGRSNGYDN